MRRRWIKIKILTFTNGAALMRATIHVKVWHLAGFLATGAMLGGIGVAAALFYVAASAP